jgi:hypothetical protein
MLKSSNYLVVPLNFAMNMWRRQKLTRQSILTNERRGFTKEGGDGFK